MSCSNPFCQACKAAEDRVRDADFASVYCLRNVDQWLGIPADPIPYQLGTVIHAAVQAYWQARRGGDAAPLKALQQAAVQTARTLEYFPFILARNGIPANEERERLGIAPASGQKEQGPDAGLVEFVMANPAAWPEMAAAYGPPASMHENPFAAPFGVSDLRDLFSWLRRTGPKSRREIIDFTKKPGAVNGEPVKTEERLALTAEEWDHIRRRRAGTAS